MSAARLRQLPSAGRTALASAPRLGRRAGCARNSLAFSTTYYDSQSGQHVQRLDGVRLHELSLGSATSPKAPAELTQPDEQEIGARVASFEMPLSTLPTRAGAGVPLAYARLSEEQHTTESVERCLKLGVGASLSLKVGVGLGADAPITKVIRFAEQAAEVGRTPASLPIRVCLLDALSHESPGRVELVCAKLADAGVSVLTLSSEDEHTDCEALDDFIEALLLADVEGTPMQDRVRPSLQQLPHKNWQGSLP